MSYGNEGCTLLILVTLLLPGICSPRAAQNPSNSAREQAERTMRNAAGRIACQASVPRPDLLNAEAELREQAGIVGPEERPILDYLMARVSFLMRKPIPRAEPSSEQALSMLAEHRVIHLQAVGDTPREAVSEVRVLAELLPLSGWGRQIDSMGSVFLADIKPSRPVVPTISRKEMLSIASEFERAGLHDLAWRAYVEAVYASFFPVWPSEAKQETWLSRDAAVYWVKAAESAHRAGHKALAREYLVKSSVFGDKKLQQRAEKIRARWGGASAPTAKTDKDAKRKALERIVCLYAGMNAHPRAFLLMDEQADSFAGSQALRKDMEQQWLAIVKSSSRAAKRVVLYGSEVYPTGDPLKIRIPWLFSDETMKSLRLESKSRIRLGPQE